MKNFLLLFSFFSGMAFASESSLQRPSGSQLLLETLKDMKRFKTRMEQFEKVISLEYIVLQVRLKAIEKLYRHKNQGNERKKNV